MKNTKNILLSIFLILLCTFLGYNLWKNSQKSSSTEGSLSLTGDGYSGVPEEDFSNTAKDTLFGYKGSERAGMYSFPNGERQFVYQKYNIRVGKPIVDTIKGEKITVIPKEGGISWEVPVPNDSYFGGFYRDHMIVNVGASTENRELLFIDVKDKRPSYRSAVVDTPSIIAGKCWFHVPIEESEMKKVPECPEKSEWEQKGLKTGFAQLCLYDFTTGSVTRKSEYKCVSKK